jgi:orotate phosphoribosyltransferase
MEVLGMVSIFTYGFDLSVRNFEQAKVPYVSLSDYDTLIRVGIEEDLIPEAQIERLKAWRKSPDSWV